MSRRIESQSEVTTRYWDSERGKNILEPNIQSLDTTTLQDFKKDLYDAYAATKVGALIIDLGNCSFIGSGAIRALKNIADLAWAEMQTKEAHCEITVVVPEDSKALDTIIGFGINEHFEVLPVPGYPKAA